MNYIKMLESKVAKNEQELVAIDDRIKEFRIHLCSTKFLVDTTIQVADVHRWLDYIMYGAE